MAPAAQATGVVETGPFKPKMLASKWEGLLTRAKPGNAATLLKNVVSIPPTAVPTASPMVRSGVGIVSPESFRASLHASKAIRIGSGTFLGKDVRPFVGTVQTFLQRMAV